MSLNITHFKSDGELVTMVGSGAVWEGYQAEIDFFSFHAERFARFVGASAEIPVMAYQSDNQVYGLRKNGVGWHGVFTIVDDETKVIALRDAIEDIS